MPQILGTAKPKIASLEGLRGLAIALVFMVHYAVAWTMIFPHAADDSTFTGLFADMAFSVGNSGVDLFMALSGYLIYDHLMLRPQTFAAYLGRRVRRIFPTYLVVLSIYVMLMLLDPAKSKLPTNAAAAMAYVTECALLIPSFFGHEPIVGIAWSLTYEIAFYLLLPLVILATGLRQRSWHIRVIILLCVAAVIVLATTSIGHHERVIMFVGGMLAREILVRWRYAFPRPVLVEVSLLAVVILAVIYMALTRGPLAFTYPDPPQSIVRSLVLTVAFPAVLIASLGVHGVCRRLFEFQPLRLFGEFSYSFYLVHNLTIRIGLPLVMAHVSSGIPSRFYWLAMPATFAVCAVAGLGLYAVIERPLSLRQPVLSPILNVIRSMRRDIAVEPNS
jgi:exopolysaccharide production protein ExoZ